MKESIAIQAEPRSGGGTLVSNRLRRTGVIPAVLYSEGKPSRMISLNAHAFEGLLRRHRGEHMIMDLAIGGEPARKVLLKDVQHHAVKGQAIHVDFYEVSMTRKLKVGIPIRLMGDPVGVVTQGGILDHLLREVEVECLPGDLIEQIEIDVSGLEMGRHLSVSDIQLDPARYRVLTAGDIAIAAVSAPAAEESAAAATVEGEAAAGEPEVTTEKKPGEGEAAEGEKKDDKKGEKKDDKKGEKKDAKK
jgi:large subunit ribosomal protein L25